ncbi:N-acetylmuramoyl-L-alanine amidase [uncultured Butyricimonas sp.]|uniref:N-acetylmuramoyl-L-alanine amidase family protein n=1 Tax=uncultured Butyricimonas sp. TaxID=1268785 RepID=UPI0026DBFD7C|nr:N-acetylmuramoyl-L-alanine amidase [uncultured Butyricimonas sp.]
MKYIFIIYTSILFIFLPIHGFTQETGTPGKGEGILQFLKRFERTKPEHYTQFMELNKSKLDKNNGLRLGVKYTLPPMNREGNEPLFGEKLAKYTIESDELKGACFYLVSGHGGPDPGAIGVLQGHQLHEDEYAYDIMLRLARTLMSKGAKVHIIIQDTADGIRDDKFLNTGDRETCMGDPIPLNQVQRLKQRCDKINTLFRKDKEAYRRAIFIHLDSRSESKQIDVFFYHYEGSAKGKHLANTLQDVFNKKYDKHQPNRGFSGTVNTRDLYVIKQTLPVAVFLELGNIQNSRDQQRFLLNDNRQALANWICEGLTQDFRHYSK